MFPNAKMLLPNLLKSTRQFFWNQNFDEVEIPYLNPSLPLEPNIYSFNTIWTHSNAKFYLPTSPEFALKKHLSQSKKDCFAISHCFRDLENSGPHHTPEFLMLEYYLVNKNLSDLIDFTKQYVSLFIRNLKFEILNLPANLPDNEPDFNQYFLNEIEPKLPQNKAVFITGYPAYLSPLAKSADAGNVFLGELEPAPQTHRRQKKSFPNQPTAKRFELYINGIEIANGCEENTDSKSIKQAFETEKEYRLKNNLPLHPYSEDFINSCAALPPCSGVGLGLNRLNMLNLSI